MFVKNTDGNATAILRTRIGFKRIQAGETIELPDNCLLKDLPSNLKIVEEAEATKPVEQKPAEQKAKATETKPAETKKEDVKPAEDKKDETKTNNALDVKVEETALTIEQVEARIEDLKKSWEQASTPRKKEAIQKEIKELQERAEKLKAGK